MNGKTIKALLCGTIVMGMCATMAISQDSAKKPITPTEAKPTNMQPADAMPEMTPQMKACMELGQLNENHARFADMVGTWKADCKFWDGNSEAPMESTGVMTNTLLHDGHYLGHDFKGECEMHGQKMSFSGSGVCAYNNATKKFETTWTDSWSTGVMFMTGTFDAAKNTFNFTGEMDAPNKEGKIVKCKFRETMTINSPTKHTQQMFCTYPGEKETKVMEIVYNKMGRGTAEIPATINR